MTPLESQHHYGACSYKQSVRKQTIHTRERETTVIDETVSEKQLQEKIFQILIDSYGNSCDIERRIILY